jgi:hypothetical protein
MEMAERTNTIPPALVRRGMYFTIVLVQNKKTKLLVRGKYITRQAKDLRTQNPTKTAKADLPNPPGPSSKQSKAISSERALLYPSRLSRVRDFQIGNTYLWIYKISG